MARKISIFAIIGLLTIALVACGGPEEKKARFFNKGQQLFDQGEYVKAGLEFKNAIQIDPKYAEGYYMLGRTVQRQGDLKSAYGAFAKAVDLDPHLLEAQLEMGRMLLLGGRSEDAMDKAALILKEKPDDIDALLLKGSVLLALKKNAAAIGVLGELKSHTSEKPEIFLLLATAYARDNNLPRAEVILKEGLAAHPDFVPLHLGLVRFYGESMQPEKAETALRKVIELEPDKATYKFNLAELYWKEGRQAAAIDTITEVVESDPSDERIRMTAALFFKQKNQFGQAAQVLEAAAEAMPESHLIRFQLGEVYLNQQKTEKAVAVLKSCLKLSKDPADAGILQAKNALARVYLVMRQLEIAERYIEEVLAQNPKSVDAHLTKGTIQLGRGESASAVSEFRIVVAERPAFIPAYLNLANAHILGKEVNLAVDVLMDALKVDDTSKDVRRKLARIYIDLKDPQAVEAQLRKIVEQHPDDMRARIDLGDFLVTQQQLPQAEAIYRDIVDKAPEYPLSFLRLARLQARLGRSDKALAELETGYAKNPLSAPLLTALIQTYVSQDRQTDAVAVCRKRIEANPRDVFAYNLLGWVNTEQKNYTQAEENLKTAIEMQPLWPAPHNNLARLYLRQGKKSEAITKLQASIRTNPRDATGYLTLAMIYEQAKDYAGARQVYEKALEHNPKFWFAANNLAYLIAENASSKGELKRARTLAEQALSLRPGEPAVLDTMAWVCYRQAQYNQAYGFMEQALVAAPDAPILNYHMGMVLYRLDRAEEAKEKLQKALSSDENFIGREQADKTLKELS